MSERDDTVEQAFHEPIQELLEAVGGGYVELGGQMFTQAEWAVVQQYAKGHTLSAMQDQEDSTAEQVGLMADASRGLDFLLKRQLDVEIVWGRQVDPANPEAVSQYIRDVILCATDELHEVLAEVNWKPWKDKRGIKDVSKYREEMADVLHFIFDLYLAAGLSGRDIVNDYLDKNSENLARNKSAEYRAS